MLDLRLSESDFLSIFTFNNNTYFAIANKVRERDVFFFEMYNVSYKTFFECVRKFICKVWFIFERKKKR